MGTLTEDWSVPLGRVGMRGCSVDLQRDEKTTARCREDNARVGPSTFHSLDGNLLARGCLVTWCAQNLLGTIDDGIVDLKNIIWQNKSIAIPCQLVYINTDKSYNASLHLISSRYNSVQPLDLWIHLFPQFATRTSPPMSLAFTIKAIEKIDGEIALLHQKHARLRGKLNERLSATRNLSPEVLTEIFWLSAWRLNFRKPQLSSIKLNASQTWLCLYALEEHNLVHFSLSSI